VDTHRGGDYDIRHYPILSNNVVGLALEPEVRLPHHKESIAINAPVGSVFAAMTDLERWADWWPQIQNVRLPEGWTVDGSMFCRVMGMDLHGAVTIYDPDRELGFETDLPVGGRVLQHFTFTPEDGGTRITAELAVSGVAGMMFTRKRLLKELDRLKVNVEEAEAR
jgi:uncharacterized protein YndB with AHSA1/START domain|tara:strand:+ start:334 stop:831 length:498 start_codon:yes stop_codon:yes gene_type:complete